MRWQRRRARWPYFVGMCALLTFTLAAPILWLRVHVAEHASTEPRGRARVANAPTENRQHSTEKDQVAASPVQPTQTHAAGEAAPPVGSAPPSVGDDIENLTSAQPGGTGAGLSSETPSALQDLVLADFTTTNWDPRPPATPPVGPILAVSDYDLSELRPALPAFEPAALKETPVESAANDGESENDGAPSATTITIVAAPEAPQSELVAAIELDMLFAARDSLHSLFESMQEIDWSAALVEVAERTAMVSDPEMTVPPPSAPTPLKSVPRVRVDGPGDRLAMAPPRPAAERNSRDPEPTLADPLSAPGSLPPTRPQRTGPETQRVQTWQATTPTPSSESGNTPPVTAAPRIAQAPAVESPPQQEAARPESDNLPRVKKPDLAPLLPHKPTTLVSQLQDAQRNSPAHVEWATATLSEVERLTTANAAHPQQAAEALVSLEQLAAQAINRAAATGHPRNQSTWLRLGQAVSRRLPIWRRLVESPEAARWRPQQQESSGAALVQTLHEIVGLTAGQVEGEKWQNYLLVEQLGRLASVGALQQLDQRRQVARKALHRLNSPHLTAEQRSFVRSPPIDRLGSLLRPWASGSVRLDSLSAVIERFEVDPSAQYGDPIKEQIERMRWSGVAELEQLAEALDRQYRSPNMRLALAGDLFNRLIPQQGAVSAPVRTQVAGSPIRGRSQTDTQLFVRLVPDNYNLRLGLEASGTVRSRTYSDTWPAIVRNVGSMQYQARKEIVVNRDGVRTYPAEAQASGTNRLVGVESRLDSVPILGWVVRDMARQQHREQRSTALRQTKSRVVREARSKMDSGAEQKLRQLESEFERIVMQPLESLALAVDPVELYTTEKRIVMRFRMANEMQLGAFTPRPSAPSDSLASVQVHESALCNAAQGLQLEGQTLTPEQLKQALSEKLSRPTAVATDEASRRATITFAKKGAVRIRCHGDRIELILGIEEMGRGRDRINDLEVHAFFRPVVDGLQLKLVRDGSLHFDGRRLLAGQRIALHTVFNQLLPKDKEIPMLVPNAEERPQIANLMITQLVIEDGWFAVAIGPSHPQRAAWRSGEALSR